MAADDALMQVMCESCGRLYSNESCIGLTVDEISVMKFALFHLLPYLSDAFLIKAGGVVQAVQATDGSISSAGPPTHHQLICGGDPSCEVTRGRRYGPCRLRVNDDDDECTALHLCQWLKIGGVKINVPIHNITRLQTICIL